MPECAPEIIEPLVNVCGYEGSSVHLKCIITGKPELSVAS